MPNPKSPPRPKPADFGPVRLTTMNRWRQREGQTEWYWRARRKGERTDVWAAWATRADAQAAVAELVKKGLPSSNPVVAPAIETVGDLLDAWVAARRACVDISLASGTADSYQNRAEHVIAWIGDVRIEQLTAPVLERYRDGRLAENKKRNSRLGRSGDGWATVKAELNALAIAWNWGRQRGFAPNREAPRVKVADTGATYNHATPDTDAVGRALNHMDGEDRIALALLATTGARKGEIVAARRRDLDPRTGVITLGVSTGAKKTGQRLFPLPTTILNELRDRCDGSDAPLIAWPGSQTVCARRQRIDRILADAAKSAGVPRFTAHGLRRYVADALLDAGVNIRDAADLLGHTPAVMLRSYTRGSDARRLSAVTRANLGNFGVKGSILDFPLNCAAADQRDGA